jgi:hypothetical protein
MASDFVIARAMGGEPIKRVVIESGERVIYIAAPDKLAAVETGESEPVGFPKEDVFYYETNTYNTLRAQWDSNGKTDSAVWIGLRRYNAAPKSKN